ncbi:endonuclease/exonuclease/phosphatase family protein [Muriicola soli]|uniref:Endonuclease/exonuclease/phosphatase family protein n=1 Tax=Muriicola soli TaxID=2507538 RepID=A0A411EBS8_9FLAO|nr:endonuclease/exonuclease/phosphatase family protein [Muriicola soli]QBA65191.1 endonuclease/exonuclease/phosphatase family protein [Muriicola soli]
MNCLITISILLFCFSAPGQASRYQVRTVAFYNLENLFDTIDDPKTFDEDFTPSGKFKWTVKRYEEKIENLAGVIAGIGYRVRKSAPDILGICEVENYQTLSDLVNHTALKPFDYGIIHKDGPDARGIDVALIYRKASFIPVSIQAHRLVLLDKDRFIVPTRYQLVVHGFLEGMPLYLLVNHWPSRRGGELRSRANRIAAAELNLKIIDSIRRIEPEPVIIGMGDFNDNPNDYSMKKVLRTKNEREEMGSTDLFNPMAYMFQKGKGSLAYRDSWSLFDQIYCSGNLINGEKPFRWWKVNIYDPPELKISRGLYKGYPLRTITAGRYTGGFSDHFPVFGYLIKELKPLLGKD